MHATALWCSHSLLEIVIGDVRLLYLLRILKFCSFYLQDDVSAVA